MLAPSINCGWVTDLTVPDRTNQVKRTATIRLNEPVPAGRTYQVTYQTTDGTATVAENDYTAIPATTVTFAEGERDKTFEVTITGKGAAGQPPEEFYIDLTAPSEGSTTFGIGARLTVRLTGDTSALTLSLADASGAEGESIAVVATLSREATGPFTFTWSTRQQVSPINRAPASVYTAVASATATIPEGQTTANLDVQTIEVNEQVQSRNQLFEVVADQTSFAVTGGDTIAAVGHDLDAQVTVVRNQYVAPNVVFNLPVQYVSQDAARGAFFTGEATVARNDRNSWPQMYLRGELTGFNALLGAHVFLRISGLHVSDDTTTQWFPLGDRVVLITPRVSPSISTWNAPVIYPLPIPSDGTDPWYAKATYTNFQFRLSGTLFTLQSERASGFRLPGNAATQTRSYLWPSS